MKFGKEFLCQMVPEWQAAYMDYNRLKGILKEIEHLKGEIRKRPAARPSSSSLSSTGTGTETVTGGGLKRRMTMYRAFSGLTRMRSGGKQQRRSERSSSGDGGDSELQAILVNAAEEEGSSSSPYETMFLMSSSDEGGECYEVEFFKRLDKELNKVNEFYKAKVEEVLKEAYTLNTQMDALIALRLTVENPNYHPPPITCTISTSWTASPSSSASAPHFIAHGNNSNNGNGNFSSIPPPANPPIHCTFDFRIHATNSANPPIPHSFFIPISSPSSLGPINIIFHVCLLVSNRCEANKISPSYSKTTPVLHPQN